MREKYKSILRRISELEGARKTLRDLFEEEEKKHSAASKIITECDQALTLLELIGTTGREKIKGEIETLVTHALQTTFDEENIRFITDFVKRRNQIECDLLLGKGDRLMEPQDGDGGGYTDIISTSLRFVVLTMLAVGGPCFLDEPGKFVSEEYRESFLRFLNEFSERAKRQIIMSTQVMQYKDPSYNLFEVEHDGNRSVVQHMVVEDAETEQEHSES